MCACVCVGISWLCDNIDARKRIMVDELRLYTCIVHINVYNKYIYSYIHKITIMVYKVHTPTARVYYNIWICVCIWISTPFPPVPPIYIYIYVSPRLYHTQTTRQVRLRTVRTIVHFFSSH